MHGRSFMVLILTIAMMVTGCDLVSGTSSSTNKNEMTIRISMYNDIAYSSWRTYVEQKFKDVTFVWENNRNSTQNLIYQAKHGDMADLVMIRRFENDSAAELAPYLLDLKSQKLESTFIAGSLEPFTFNNKVCWFPAPGMMETLIANVSLFDRYGIKVPETISELKDACSQFENLGINGLSIDASMGYRSTYLLEGMGYAGFFSKGSGNEYMKKILAGTSARLSEDAGNKLFSLMQEFVSSSVLQKNDETSIEENINREFDTEKAAIFLYGSDKIYNGKLGSTYQSIPCLGETKDDQILYTYPIFNTGVSKKAAKDPKKKKLIEQVLKVMYSETAQKKLAEGADALMSYNKNVDLPVSDIYQSVSSLIKNKQSFIRFLNRNTFTATANAVKKIIDGETSITDVTTAFNKDMNAKMDTTVIGTSDIEAGNELGEESALQRPAASVIAQAVKAATKADAVIIDGKSAAAPIYKGKYTQNDLNAVIADEPLFKVSLTGKQLQDVFDDSILATTTYKYRAIEPIVDYPALSGVKAYLSADGKKNTLKLSNGKSLDPNKKYQVVISLTIKNALDYLQNEYTDKFIQTDMTLMSVFMNRLKKGSLPEPVEYFKVEGSK